MPALTPVIEIIYGGVRIVTYRVISRARYYLLDILYSGIVSNTLLQNCKHSRKNVNGLEVIMILGLLMQK